MSHLLAFYCGAAFICGLQYWSTNCRSRYDKTRWKVALSVMAGLLWLPLWVTKTAMVRLSVVAILLVSQAYAEGMVLQPGTYSNRTFDAGGDSFAVKLLPGTYRFDICQFLNAKHFLLDADGPVILTVEGCTFSNSAAHCVRFRGAAKGLVAHSKFTDWLHYAVFAEGTAEAGPVVTVDDCELQNPKPGKGGARAMIFATNPKKVVNVEIHVTNTRCIGPGQQYEPKNPASIGTSDQVSFNFCSRFSFTNSLSTGGGENGATFTNGSCNGLIYASTFSQNNGHGVQMASAVDVQAHDIVATSNRCLDNGKFHGQEKDTIAGVYIHGGKRIAAIDNEISGNTKYGILAAESELLRIAGNRITSDRKDEIPIQVYVDKSLVFDGHWGIYQSATIDSNTADPIVHVTADDVTLKGLALVGGGKSDGVRQRGIFSDSAKRGHITGCSGKGMTNWLKLDGTADNWIVEDYETNQIVGVADGSGYHLLITTNDNVIRNGRMYGTPGFGRHGVYLCVKACRNRLSDLLSDGMNSSSFVQYAKADQPGCVGNTYDRCVARNQLTGHDGTNGGAPEAGAFEFTGKVSGATLRDSEASKIATNGLVINTLGLDARDVTVERFKTDGIGGKPIFLKGARKVRLTDCRGNVEVHPWWQTSPKRASEDIEIVRLVGKVIVNPTLPTPKNVTVDGKVLTP